MPIQPSDILFKYSVTSGATGNSTPQIDSGASLGKFISTSAWPGGVPRDLFPNITSSQNAGFVTDYRCLFIHNSHATLTLQAAKIWFSAIVVGGADVMLGVDPAPASVIGSSTAQAAQVPDANTAPAGVSFATPTTEPAAISLGNIPPGYCVAIWVKRSATNSAAVNSDGFTFTVKGDTGA